MNMPCSTLTLTGILGFVNLCYAVFCAFFVLNTPPTPPEPHFPAHTTDTPSKYPNPHDPAPVPVLTYASSTASHDAFCACVLFATGCVNLTIAIVRAYQARAALDTPPADWATTAFFVLAGLTNHATAYLFLRARLEETPRGCVHACGTPTTMAAAWIGRDVKRCGWVEKC
ncbi:hypothetical protein D9615_007713 [Tricholomella constricta]|uniref:Uncharacterized protein n=1 Tax=Tricholomella constricta TaxID=117010 RepID=A0A8H5H3F1_9AGAR|nr:hypothetical protein D9615_007713 [Tricholomella constricta]